MKHIKATALAALLAFTLGTQADDKVVVVTANGQTEYNTSDVARIEIGDTQLKVVAADGTGTTYAFDEVLRIALSADGTGISTPTAAAAARLTLTVSSDGTQMRVNGWDAQQTAPLTVYTTNGAAALHFDAWSGQAVDITALPSGVYVVKAGKHTAKFRK